MKLTMKEEEVKEENKSNFKMLFLILVHAKKCWVVSTHVWVKYGQTQLIKKKPTTTVGLVHI